MCSRCEPMLLSSLCSVYLVGGIFVSIFNEKNNLNYLFHNVIYNDIQ